MNGDHRGLALFTISPRIAAHAHKEEVDESITWLTGYDAKQLQRVLDTKVDFETFFAKAPA